MVRAPSIAKLEAQLARARRVSGEAPPKSVMSMARSSSTPGNILVTATVGGPPMGPSRVRPRQLTPLDPRFQPTIQLSATQQLLGVSILDSDFLSAESLNLKVSRPQRGGLCVRLHKMPAHEMNFIQRNAALHRDYLSNRAEEGRRAAGLIKPATRGPQASPTRYRSVEGGGGGAAAETLYAAARRVSTPDLRAAASQGVRFSPK